MKILLTGVTGFIGRNLEEHLKEKYRLYSPPGRELDLLKEEDVAQYLKKHCFDTVIHSAAWGDARNSRKDQTKVLEYNLRMFFNIARCSDMFGRMIYFGSAAEYDRKHCIHNMTEDYFDTHIPANDYGFAKYVMMKYTEKSSNIYNLRLFSVFGKYEPWDIRFISNAICKTLFNLPVTINQNALYHYLYINDLIPVVEYFIHHNNPEYKVYNIIPDEAVPLYALAEKIKIISKKDLPIIVAKEGMGTVYTGNNSRLKKEMAHIKFTPLDCSIKELYNWYSDNINMIDKKLLLVDK